MNSLGTKMFEGLLRIALQTLSLCLLSCLRHKSVMPEPGGGPLPTPQCLVDQLILFQQGGGQIVPTLYYWHLQHPCKS